MSSLQFYICVPRHYEPIKEPFSFSELPVEGHDPTETSSASDRTLSFRSTEVIYDYDTRVYRGIFTDQDGQETKAVCKFVLDAGTQVKRRFQREAKMYQTKLRDLQGYCIPRFYGLYSGQVVGNNSMCMILEDCGESVGTYDTISMEWCIMAVRILMAIHKRGVQHNDFHPRNLIIDNFEKPTRLVVVDFEHATQHECRRELDLDLYTLPPFMCEFNCNELWDAADNTLVWTPSSVCIFGGFVSVRDFTTPEELLALAPDYDDRYEPEEALKRAKAVIRGYLRQWKDRKPYVLGNVRETLLPVK
ncbi:hypothetical protein NM688_g2067 [Phlebia brevispora]|uniref:Uncharacterized protein n=1 Tax=Phlebia brevispora TaxID=194682 RepID=A0ACC1T9K2_9APHY|nr:hypothetical protein NM688_g2067 [Phlebia brevispora]